MLYSLLRTLCYLLVLFAVFVIGQTSIANEPNIDPELSSSEITESKVGTLNQEKCQQAVSNIRKGIPLLKRKLRKNSSRDMDQITKNIINAKLAELKSKASIEDCIQSKGKPADGYLCMSKTTDLEQCVAPK